MLHTCAKTFRALLRIGPTKRCEIDVRQRICSPMATPTRGVLCSQKNDNLYFASENFINNIYTQGGMVHLMSDMLLWYIIMIHSQLVRTL